MLDGETIWYYAAGYTDSGKKIPMNKDSCAMFSGCKGLKSIDLSGFDTSKVTKMGGFYSGTSAPGYFTAKP